VIPNNGDLSHEVIQRIVGRLFAPDEHPMAMRVLDRYGPKPHHVEKVRVRLCALKLAGSDLRELERQIDVACVDFRDVIAAAEYPAQCKLGFIGFGRLRPSERLQIEEADRLQFQAWVYQGQQ